MLGNPSYNEKPTLLLTAEEIVLIENPGLVACMPACTKSSKFVVEIKSNFQLIIISPKHKYPIAGFISRTLFCI